MPPKDEAFKQNVARAHLQVAIWRVALASDPPVLDPSAYGWSQEEGTTSLTATTVSDGVTLAPNDLLNMIRCSCASEMACKSQRCSCNSSSLACTAFRLCQGGHTCCNNHTQQAKQDEDNEDDDGEVEQNVN